MGGYGEGGRDLEQLFGLRFDRCQPGGKRGSKALATESEHDVCTCPAPRPAPSIGELSITWSARFGSSSAAAARFTKSRKSLPSSS
ncbi:MAG: hypothetical protein DLM67_00390 [Candidatus Nephthysia bennettiae]|nr:MAG: hypothetical protein DLM67_00390 [Candidatus Dormibacteraeota bacterium]